MFLSCEYGEGDTKEEVLQSYEGFKVSEDDNERTFKSDNPVKDFEDASEYIAKRIEETGASCGMSSSVDHFVTDCDGIFDWYTDTFGVERFDYAEKVPALEEKHKEERTKLSTAVWHFLQKLGVPEEVAKNDTIAIFQNCSPQTFLALSKHLENVQCQVNSFV